jgi:hypothetical protein
MHQNQKKNNFIAPTPNYPVQLFNQINQNVFLFFQKLFDLVQAYKLITNQVQYDIRADYYNYPLANDRDF